MSRRVVNFNGLASVSSVWGYMVCNDKRWYEKHAQFLQASGMEELSVLVSVPVPVPVAVAVAVAVENVRASKANYVAQTHLMSLVQSRRSDSSRVKLSLLEFRASLSWVQLRFYEFSWIEFFFLCCLFKHNRTTNFYLIFTIYLTTDTVETSYRWSKLQ